MEPSGSSKKKGGGKISVWSKIALVFFGLMGLSILTNVILPSFVPKGGVRVADVNAPETVLPAPETDAPATTYFVKPRSANVRECPSSTCKVIDTMVQNTEIAFFADQFQKFPEWVEITLADGRIGYVSKTVLSEVSVSPVRQVAPAARPATDDIALGAGSFDPLMTGYSYDISFCMPASARSGATCGGLAGTTETPVGGSPPYSIVKASGFLPPGMSLELNGLLSGSPTTVGTYDFELCAKDLKMNQGCQNYTLVVKEADGGTGTEPVASDGGPSVLPNPPTAEEGYVRIDSATCPIYKEHDACAGDTCIHYVDTIIIGSGSAAGQEGAFFWVGSNPGFGMGENDDPRSYGFTCSSWTKNSLGHCVREAGQPFSTTWTVRAPGSGYSTNFPTHERSIALQGHISNTPVVGGINDATYAFKCRDD